MRAYVTTDPLLLYYSHIWLMVYDRHDHLYVIMVPRKVKIITATLHKNLVFVIHMDVYGF